MNIPWAAMRTAALRLPPRMDSTEAAVVLVAIGLQESGFETRRQRGNGPARGFWQFEQGGGVRGVLQHNASRQYALELCALRGVPATDAAVWAAMERDDVLSAGFARLLLWTDPASLPALGDSVAAWELYARTWRPGKPHPERWPANYERAAREVAQAAAS